MFFGELQFYRGASVKYYWSSPKKVKCILYVYYSSMGTAYLLQQLMPLHYPPSNACWSQTSARNYLITSTNFPFFTLTVHYRSRVKSNILHCTASLCATLLSGPLGRQTLLLPISPGWRLALCPLPQSLNDNLNTCLPSCLTQRTGGVGASAIQLSTKLNITSNFNALGNRCTLQPYSCPDSI